MSEHMSPISSVQTNPRASFEFMAAIYKPLLLLLPCIYLFTLFPFQHLINPTNLWHTDPYRHRKARVEKACRDFRDQIKKDEKKRDKIDHHVVGPEGDPPDPNVLVSRKERFFWCKVPKAASTSWKAYFLKQSGKGVEGMESWSGPQISARFWNPAKEFLQFSDAQDVTGMDSFITVRHPFERLLSAYRDRFFAMDTLKHELEKEALFRRRYGLDIIRNHR